MRSFLVTQASSFGRGRGWRNGSVLWRDRLGGQSGAQESGQCVWALEGEVWNPGTPPFPGSAVHPTVPFCRGLLLPSTPTPTIATPGAYNGIERGVGVARCRGRGRYAGHWWPLAWPTWVGLEGCWAPRSGSWPQSRGLGLLPTPILSLWVICPSVPGGALEGLCWVGCTEGALV